MKSQILNKSVGVQPYVGRGVTGRDGYLTLQALAYAIETIDRLPPRWQEWSNMLDMIDLLDMLTPHADEFRLEARGHIEQRGTVRINGKPVLAERPAA
jgi:hypothetical protein